MDLFLEFTYEPTDQFLCYFIDTTISCYGSFTLTLYIKSTTVNLPTLLFSFNIVLVILSSSFFHVETTYLVLSPKMMLIGLYQINRSTCNELII